MDKLKQSNILKLIFFAITVFYSGYAIYTMVGSEKYLVVLAALIFALMLFSTEKNIEKSFNFFLYYLANTLIVMTINIFEGATTYFVLISLVFVAYVVVRNFDFIKLIRVFLTFITVVAIISLIGYYLVNKTTWLDNLPRKTNSNNVEYACGYIFFYIPIIKTRNCGIFWEPGIFATFLVLGIVFEAAFSGKKISFLRILILSITTITTQSSAGYVLLLIGIVFVCLVLSQRVENVAGKFLSYFAIFAVLLLLIFSNFIIRNTALAKNVHFSKLLFENILEQSRTKAFVHNMEIFLDNPIFGAGFQVATDSMAHVADTSTTTYILSVFGIFGIMHLVMITYGVFKIKGISVVSKSVLWLLLVLIINKEPHLFNLFTWILIFYLVNGVNCSTEKNLLKR